MGASFAVETEKLRRRPAGWVLAGILAAFIALTGYAANYALVSISGTGGAGSPFAQLALPSGMPSTVLGSIPGVGAALAVILGAIFMGSEYRWDTVKASVVRKPGRLGMLGGKMLTLLAAALILVLVALVTGFLSSLVIALLLGSGLGFPPLGQTAAAFGAGWLILSTYAVLGLFFAVLLRGSGSAVAFGLVYVLILESIISSLASQLPSGQWIGSVLPGGAAQSLAGAVSQQLGGEASGSGPLSSPLAAILLLLGWLVLLGGLSLLLFTRRDSP